MIHSALSAPYLPWAKAVVEPSIIAIDAIAIISLFIYNALILFVLILLEPDIEEVYSEIESYIGFSYKVIAK